MKASRRSCGNLSYNQQQTKRSFSLSRSVGQPYFQTYNGMPSTPAALRLSSSAMIIVVSSMVGGSSSSCLIGSRGLQLMPVSCTVRSALKRPCKCSHQQGRANVVRRSCSSELCKGVWTWLACPYTFFRDFIVSEASTQLDLQCQVVSSIVMYAFEFALKGAGLGTKKYLFLQDRLVVQGGSDRLLFFFLRSPESLSFLSNQPLFVFSMCPRTVANVFRMAKFRFIHKAPGVGSSMQGSSPSFCCKSVWNLAFTSSQHSLLTLSCSTELPFFLGVGLNCSLSRQRKRR